MTARDVSRKPSVLIVEDEFLIRMGIVDSIQRAGFEIFEAGNADEAIRLLEEHPDITVLFTDIDMPGSMDGLKLAAAVRRRWPPVKIIVTSGHVKMRQEDLPVEGRFFAKPYDHNTILSTLLEFSAG
jgi:YesN/AraC family two-component response regulator